MKTSTMLVCLLLLCSHSAIQALGLTPSTVRQVFSLQKGDSLEYHTWTMEVPPSCGLLCDVYRLSVIDSTYYNITLDTLFITFSSRIIYKDTFATSPSDYCDNCHPTFIVDDYYVISSGMWIVTNLDSNIKWAMDTIYGTLPGSGEDTSYINPSQYNGSKQNAYGYFYNMMSSLWETYVDSLGIVYKTEFDQTATNNTERLIYYHKANGSMWGTPFISTGIADIADEYHVSVYPNPAEDRFVVHTDLYQGLRFELYDVLSDRVMNLNLSGTETRVSRNGLSTGIYFWQLTDGANVIKTGKMILE